MKSVQQAFDTFWNDTYNHCTPEQQQNMDLDKHTIQSTFYIGALYMLQMLEQGAVDAGSEEAYEAVVEMIHEELQLYFDTASGVEVMRGEESEH